MNSRPGLPIERERPERVGLLDGTIILCLDLDDVADLTATRAKLQTDSHVFAVFLSVGGKGLKAFVAVEASDASEHKKRRSWS